MQSSQEGKGLIEHGSVISTESFILSLNPRSP